MGIKTTTTGVLLTKADKTATISINTNKTLNSFLPANFSNHSPKASIVPVLSNAALNTNIQDTIIGAGFENTESALFSSKMPIPISKTKAPMATRSGENHSLTKATKTNINNKQTTI